MDMIYLTFDLHFEFWTVRVVFKPAICVLTNQNPDTSQYMK